jgi:hypothetical protein
MRLRIVLAALLCALFVGLGGCGSPSPPAKAPSPTTTLTFSEPDGAKCVTREPPAMGECVAQAERAAGHKLTLVAPLTGTEHQQCADWSVYQGGEPDTSGLHCVIVQAAYGLNVERSVYSQIRDARDHGLPYGVYDFGEPGIYAGDELAFIHSLAPSATLGYWFDAEVSGVFWRSCEFTSEAQDLGLRIFGVFSYPGGYVAGGGTRCAGLLWPSEWGVSGPYAFGGYPSSAIVLWQDCGTCIRPPDVETDLDVDEGLIALANPPKPKPPSHSQLLRELHQAEQTRHALHKDIEAHRCRRGEHNLPREPERLRLKYHGLCGYWIKRGGEVIVLEGKLRKELG